MLTAYFLIHMGVVLRHCNISAGQMSWKNNVVFLIFNGLLLVILQEFGTISLVGNSYDNIGFLFVCSLAGWFLLSSLLAVLPIGIVRLLAYAGRHTMPVLLFHFLAFKIVSAIGIWVEGKDVCKIAEFPVSFRGGLWFVAYAFAGMALPIGITELVRFARRTAIDSVTASVDYVER